MIERKATAAAVYCRISQDVELTGLGVERQRQDCEALAEQRGWRVAEVFTDNDVSAYDRRKVRPQYRRLIAGLSDGTYDGLIVYNIDRLYRQPRELEDLIELCEDGRIGFATCSGDIDLGTAGGCTVARILVAVSNQASKDAARRLDRKFLANAEAGRRHGGSRHFGYDAAPDATWTVNEREAETIRWAADQILTRGVRIGTLQKLLAARGDVTTKGHGWTWYGLRRMLTSPTLIGQRSHNGTLSEGTWPSILTIQQHSALVAALQPEADPSKRNHTQATTPLAGLLYCGVCGARMVHHTGTTRRARTDAHTLRCPDAPSGHQCTSVVESAAEAFVIATVRDTLQSKVLEAAAEVADAPREAPEVAEIATLRQRLDGLVEQAAAGDLSGAVLGKATAAIEKRIAALETAYAATVRTTIDNGLGWIEPERLAKLIAQPVTELDIFEAEDLHQALRRVIERVTVSKSAGPRRPVSERLSITWR